MERDDGIRQAVDLLLRARRTGALLPDEALCHVLGTVEDVYAVQDLVAAEVGTVGAWKVGAASPEAEPVAAPIFEADLFVSPARPEAGRFHRFGIETEIAYRFEHDLPPRAEPYRQDEVMAAASAVLPAIEIVDSRTLACEHLEPLWKLADNQINGGLVVGEPLVAASDHDPTTQPFRLEVAGTVVAEGRGGNAAGDPRRLLTWLANHLTGRTGGLRAGQIVTTGSLTGLRFVEAGQPVTADFEGLGRVELVFA
ncbi:MAG: fumarylacetoacetate hydrolase family protein [Geminicoccaceae bacterium]|nr:fumarylacetoacetate hydrolase family protein [Geminicoccaceae bacterium]